MNKRFRLILLIGFLLVIIVGGYLFYLSTHPPQGTYSFLLDEACALPCWENITPGESTQLEALNLLVEGSLIDRSARYLGDGSLFLNTQNEDKVHIYFSEGIVQQIDFDPSASLVLDDFIETFGPPEKVHMLVDGEHQLCMVGYLYYPRHGLLISAGECADFNRTDTFKNGNVLPDTPVISLSFVEVSTNAEQVLQSLQRVQGVKLEEVPLNWVDWKGHGYYEP
ncbi:hypothetical protein [Candidatus Leptofilum sp.]|uniref:hypothetical protein n=1 Tax=Candidatus Leptofilum sp. TaxID=3241576 RepID=UPI003B5A397A